MTKKAVDTTRIRLLIVDDDRKFLDVISERMGLKAIDVTSASEGKAALDAAVNQRYDVAVVDLKMPGMDGMELLGWLKKNDPFIEVIMLTGFASIQSAVECTRLGAYGYLEKPYNFDNLVRMIEEAHAVRLEKKAEADDARMSQIQKICMQSSPKDILKKLATMDAG